MALLVLLLSLASALAGELPPELEAWAPWVLHDHPQARCTWVGEERRCEWPGVLSLMAEDTGARFVYELHLDRDMATPLPGGPGSWPQEVREGGQPVVVTAQEEVPVAWLTAGTHRLEGRMRWTSPPQSLAVPPGLGRVSLVVDGEAVARPQLEGSSLLLAPGGSAEAGCALEIDVSRRIRDGVPVLVDTHLGLRASGVAREVDLGAVALEGTLPVSLDSALPARFTPEGRLVVQVRPGTWELDFTARHQGPAAALAAPAPDGPWPERETWTLATDDQVRALTAGGLPAVDPARTALPDEWKSLPAFLVQPGAALQLTELRRGEAEPPPSQLELHRDLRLDASGQGFTVQDRLMGQMYTGWRLDLLAPGELGHAMLDGEDQVITEGPAGSGVEVRTFQVDLQAESRLPEPGQALPAVGWSTPVQQLSARVHLPPGWQLLTAVGADEVSGGLLSEWSLLDALFVLLLSLAVGKVLGWRWLPVAAVGLTLARHADGAPMWLWALLLGAMALQDAVKQAHLHGLVRALRWALVLVLTLVFLAFAVDQVQTSLAPALDDPHESSPWDMSGYDSEYSYRGGKFSDVSSGKSYDSRGWLTLQQDPGAVVQTGPGVPTWSWRHADLSWSGPVRPEHSLRLVLVGPLVGGFIALLRVLLLGLLLVRVVEIRRLRELTMPASLVATALLLCAPALAQDSPEPPAQAEQPEPPTLLGELEARLMEPPDCLRACTSLSSLDLRALGDELVLEAEVHAASTATWALPGPVASFTPTQVLVDGVPAAAMARLPDGLLHLRLEPGIHRVVATGPLPPGGLTLQLEPTSAPVRFQGGGWRLEGLRPDGTAERSLQLLPLREDAPGSTDLSRGLAPWVEVQRELDLGLPWRVRTTVRRHGPSTDPLSLRIPTLPGEAVTDERLQEQEGAVLVSLDAARTEVSWISVLQEAESVTLSAPEGVSWTESWTVSCSPIYACSFQGPPPIQHLHESHWSPRWLPWPGETLTLSASRPEAVQGQTVTIDSATLLLQPSARATLSTLDLTLRSSQGGQLPLTLPEGAALQSVKIDEVAKPVQLEEGTLPLPLHPGTVQVHLQWQTPERMGLRYVAPEVGLGTSAVNARVDVEMATDRFALWTSGPVWGPAVLVWTRWLLVLLAAPFLARVPFSPLKTWQWALLGLGLACLPVPVYAIAVAFFLAFGARAKTWPADWGRFNLMQIGLAILAFVAAIALYSGVHVALISAPDTWISGQDSTRTLLHWYADRVGTHLPRPVVWTLPVWAWRTVGLAWTLWLVASLWKWIPWTWRAFTTDGMYKQPARKKPAPIQE